MSWRRYLERRPARAALGIQLVNDPRLLRFADGTFTRSTEGSLESEPGVVAWYGVNVPRIRPDGLWLFEGGSTNLIVAPENLADAAWVTTGQTTTANAVVAPDGVQDAALVSFLAAADRNAAQAVAGTADNVVHAGSLWVRAMPEAVPIPAANMRYSTQNGLLLNSAELITLTQSWQRRTLAWNVGSDVADTAWWGLRSSGVTAIGQQWSIWGAQLEALPFPTSYIRLGTSTARGVDVLTYATAPPAAMLSGRWQFDFAPIHASNEFADNTAQHLFQLNSGNVNDGVYILNATGTGRIRLAVGGVNLVNVAPVTWSRNQKMTVSIDMAAGTMALSGATTGNFSTSFTPTPFTATVFAVGARNGGSQPAWCAISEPRAW